MNNEFEHPKLLKFSTNCDLKQPGLANISRNILLLKLANRIGPAKFQLIMFSFVLISASKDSQVLRVCHLSLHILAYQILKYNQVLS